MLTTPYNGALSNEVGGKQSITTISTLSELNVLVQAMFVLIVSYNPNLHRTENTLYLA